jgi:hypothetical protein
MYTTPQRHVPLTAGTSLFTVLAVRGASLLAAEWAFITVLHVYDFWREKRANAAER